MAVALAEARGVPAILTYSVPEELRHALHRGACVAVPLGPRRATGIVLGPATGTQPQRLRPVLEILCVGVVPAELLELAHWAARYYQAPATELLRAILPPAIRGGHRRRVVPAATARAAGNAPTGGLPLLPAEAPEEPTLDARILARLAPGGLDLEQLREELGAGVTAALRRLARRGAVRLEDVPIERREQPAALRAADPGGAQPELARAPRQRAVLDYVRGRAPHAVTLAELESRLPGARRAARPLIERGLLVAVRPQAESAGPPGPPLGGAAADPERAAAQLAPDLARDEAIYPSSSPGPADAGPALHPEQAAALEALDAAAGSFATFVLLGVTGSGKTEVYLRAAARTLARGRSVLLLVPEIGLTHQLVVQAERRFPGRTAVLHSGLGEPERLRAWHEIASGRKPLAIGARSAVFAPLPDLGLIVVDEEHDAAYKQEESPRYHGRDSAVMRGKLAGCPVLLASATPSLESYQAALAGRYRLLELTERANRAEMPRVEIIDLRTVHPAGRGAAPGAAPEECGASAAARHEPLSPALETALVETYRAGEQSLLFLNRRGFSRFVQCEACGQVETCPDCSVSLTVHRARRAAVCHHCGHARPPAARCGQCGAQLTPRSFGTEQIEAAARQLLPAARIARLDRDTTSSPAFLLRTLAAWRAGELDVLVGTQMIAKGHDAPGVTLIGVVLADTALNLPDFRAAERAFQLLAQVAGRAGRGSRPGRVLVQTRQPDHPSLLAASRHDFPAFARAELRSRAELRYPPHGRLTRVVLEGELGVVEREAEEIAVRLRRIAASVGGGGAQVLGPAPAPIEKLRGRFRHQLLVKAPDSRLMARLLAEARLHHAPAHRRGTGEAAALARCVVDVDPVSML